MRCAVLQVFLTLATLMAAPSRMLAHDHPEEADIRIRFGPAGFTRTVTVEWDLAGTLEYTTRLGAWKPVTEPATLLRTGYRSVTLEYTLGTFPRTLFFRVRLAEEDPDEHRHFTETPDPFVPGQILQVVDPDWQFNLPQPVYRVRLHLVRCADSSGANRVPLTTNDFQQYVNQANTIFFRSGIRFDWDPVADVEDLNNSALNSDVTPLVPLTQLTDEQNPPQDGVHYSSTNNSARRTALALSRPGKLVVYAARFGTLDDRKFSFDSTAGHWRLRILNGGKSSWAAHAVTIEGSLGGLSLLAHEVGHYLNNMHPFVLANPDNDGNEGELSDVKSYIASELANENVSPAEVPGLFDADAYWVRDTPPDPGPRFLRELNGGDSCGANATGTFTASVSQGAYAGSHTFNLLPNRLLLQSYHRCTNLGVMYQTPDQIARVRDALENRHRHHLVAQHMGGIIGSQLSQTDLYQSTTVSHPELRLVRTRHDQLVMLRRRTSDDTFQLLAFEVDAGGAIALRSNTVGVPCEFAEVAYMGLGLIAVAFTTPDQRPGVYVYRLGEDYTWTLEDTWFIALNYVREIDLERFGRVNLALACRTRDASDNTVIYALIVEASGDIRLQSYNEVGTSASIALAPAGARPLALTRRDSNGNLLLETWKLTDELLHGATLDRISSASAGAIGQAAVMALDGQHLVTPIPTEAGDLKLIHWAVDPNGLITRIGNGTTVTGLEVWDAARFSTDLIAVAARTTGDALSVRLYETDAAGNSTLRQSNTGQILAISASAMPACALVRSQHLAVARLASDGRPEIRVYSAPF